MLLSDYAPSADRPAVPALRALSRLHQSLVERGARHKVGLVVEAGIWDVHHVALLLAMGADAVAPWLGCLTARDRELSYLKGLRAGFIEAMSMLGVTPSSAYVGSRLVEAVGLDPEFVRAEFPGVPCHLGGIGREILNREWLGLHRAAYACPKSGLADVGEFRQSKEGRRHANDAGIVRAAQLASGYARKIHGSQAGSPEAYRDYSELVADRTPINVLDCLRVKQGESIALEEVEPVEAILWRFMAPGMSEGALSEPAHRAVAKAFNVLHRYCRLRFRAMGMPPPPGLGPFANSGEGGFDKGRLGRSDGNRSVQYAGGRFTITPETAARAAEAEVKFAQGAKPGKGGQLPGRKVSPRVAHQRGCEPGYELVSPPINHNLYSIEDVKLMLESWRHLNPNVVCALKYVATYGVEMVALGGVNAGANRLHLSDGCGGTGAAKRVDQKHAGVPVAAVLPTVQDLLVEEGVRHLVELSADGGVQGGDQVLKLFLLGADRVGFGTSALIAIGCSMLRQCHLAGPHPSDPTGVRRVGCAPGVATQDPALVAKFRGRGVHIARFLRYVAGEVRERMAAAGIRSIAEVVGRRDLLEKKPDLAGKAGFLDLSRLVSAPDGRAPERDSAAQSCCDMPRDRRAETESAAAALKGEDVVLEAAVEGERCLGVTAAGVIARAAGDLGLATGSFRMRHTGSAGQFYGAYSVAGMAFELDGVAGDSCFTAAYGGTLTIRPGGGDGDTAVVGNTFGYGARGGAAYIAGGAGNRFGICLRKNHEGGGPRLVVEGVQANAFQYMTGGTALVLGRTGPNLGSGMSGGAVYLLDADVALLNGTYVQAISLPPGEVADVYALLAEHLEHTASPLARCLLATFEPERFTKVVTRLVPEPLL